MAGFNGSGVFVRTFSWANDKANGINITASRFDTEDSGFATGLSTTICKDGQQTTTARIPFAVGISCAAGSVSSPMVAPTGDLTSGIYSSASGNVDIASVGTRVGGFNSGGLDNTVIGAGTPLAGSFTALAATSLTGITAFNKVTLTAPATGSTLTIADGKTLTANHTFTINGGDSAVLAIAASKTLTVSNTMTLAGGDSTNMTFPNTTGTVVTLADTQTLTNKTLTSPTITTGALGSSTATKQSALDNSTKVATTSYVDSAVAAAPSGLALLATVNASAASTVSFNSTYITSTYNKYVIEYDSVYVDTLDVVIIQVSTDNGSTWKTTGYSGVGAKISGSITAVSPATITSGAGISITCSDNLGTSLGTGAAHGQVYVNNPLNASLYPSFILNGILQGSGSITGRYSTSGEYDTAGAINAIRFIPSNGSHKITGNFHLYAIQGT